MSEIKAYVESIFDELVAIRRDIHAHPEVGMTEVRTSALIRAELEKMGMDEVQSPLPTAVVGLLHGGKGPGKCVAFRADIDALPVHEETGLPFASQNEGVMHACGHDLHATMLLGLAKTLCHLRDSFAGTVKFIFEPSEDIMPGGARKLVAAGVMENPHVDAIFGQHVCPSENDTVGTLNLYKGYFTSAVDLFHITVHGKSGHGAAPHTAHDAKMVAVLRTFGDEVRETAIEEVNRICKGIGIAFACDIEVNLEEGYAATYNDSALIDLVESSATAELGESAVRHITQPFSGSEDFSFFGKLTGTPCAFMMIDAGHGENPVSLHNGKIVFDEKVMVSGVSAMSRIALEYLKK